MISVLFSSRFGETHALEALVFQEERAEKAQKEYTERRLVKLTATEEKTKHKVPPLPSATAAH